MPRKARSARFRNSTTASRRWLFNPNTLAPEFSASTITRPFPFNGYYAEDEAPEVDGTSYKLEVGGMIDNKEPWTLDKLYALPQVSQITRHVCVEGWSAIGSWQGVRLSEFLKRIGADTRAKYVWFQCAEGYSNTIDMATALHPQTQLTFKFDDQILPRKYGFPMKCAFRPSSASRIRNTSPRSTCRTTTPAATGRTRATTGSAGSSANERDQGCRCCGGTSVISRAPRWNVTKSQAT